MCAIFGSKTLSTFKTLYKNNLTRGNFAFGGMFLRQSTGVAIIKSPNVFELAENYADIRYYNGHTQAPTSSVRTFNTATSHPFSYGNWIVSHNGVITNFHELKENVDRASITAVDSSIIPAMLHIEQDDDITQAVMSILSMINGTHATTIYNTKYNELYVTRCGSTLFVDDKGNYSSTAFAGCVEVPDASVLRFNGNQFVNEGSFVNNSPFFII